MEENMLFDRKEAVKRAFSGIWTPKGMETMSGKFVIQCKFTERKNITIVPWWGKLVRCFVNRKAPKSLSK